MVPANLSAMPSAVLSQAKGGGRKDGGSSTSGLSGTPATSAASMSSGSAGDDPLSTSPTSFLPKISKGSTQAETQKEDARTPLNFLYSEPGKGSAVEQWKKLARKTEIELHVEKDQHQASRVRDCEIIEHLNHRIEALEGAAQERGTALVNQLKKIKQLRNDLDSTSKNFERKVAKLQGQSDQMQQKLSMVMGESEQKTQLSREKDARIKGLVQEAGLFKKRSKEATCSKDEIGGFLQMVMADRDTAQFRLKELEDALMHLEGMENELAKVASQPWPEPKDMLGGLIVYNPVKFAVKWQYTQPPLPNQDDKHPYLLRRKSAACVPESTKFSPFKSGASCRERKSEASKDTQKKLLDLFHKIQESIQTILLKATAASQVATNMKVEKEFIAASVVDIKKELLGASRPPPRTEDKKVSGSAKMRNGEPIWRRDKEDASKLLAAVRELKGQVEAQKVEKMSLEASLSKKEAKLAEVESLVTELHAERSALLSSLKAISSSLGLELPGGIQREGLVNEGMQYKAEDHSPSVQKIQVLTKESDESKALLSQVQNEHASLQRNFSDLKSRFAEMRTAMAEAEKEKEILERRSVDLQTQLSEAKGITVNVMKEKEILERQIRDLQIHFNEFKTSYAALGQEKESAQRRSLDLQMLLSDAKTELDHLQGQNQPFERRLTELQSLYTQSNATVAKVQEDKEMMGRQMLSMKALYKAMDVVLGLGDTALSNNLKSALRSECGGQERLLERLMQQREELEAWREEVRKDREVSAAALQDIIATLGGTDQQNLGNQHPASTTIVASVKALKAEKEQLEQVIQQSNALCGLVQQSIQSIWDLVADGHGRGQSGNALAQEYPLLAGEFTRAVAEVPELVKLVANLKMERDHLITKLEAVESDRDEVHTRLQAEKHELTQIYSGSQQEAQTLKKHLDSAHSLLLAPPALSHDELLKQRQSITGASTSEEGESPSHPIIKGIALMKRESVLLQAKHATEERKVHELNRQVTIHHRKNEDLVRHITAAEGKIRELSQQLTAVEGWAENFSRQASAVDDQAQILAMQMAAAESALESLYALIFSEPRPTPTQMSETAKSSLKSTGGDLSDKIKEVHSKVEEVQKAKEAEIQRLAKAVTSLKLEIETLGSKMIEQEGSAEKSNLKAQYVDNLKKEVLRLGGFDLLDERERLRRDDAAERVRDIISTAAVVERGTIRRRSSVPGVYQPLEVGGNLGGICQAAVHYFRVDAQQGGITFENATLPGSQSSNLLIDLMLLPVDAKKSYETKAGDILGLHIRMMQEQATREVLYNNSVVHTDEVLEAIHGQPIDSFSLWPDLVSSWRWERTSKNRWSLVCVRWRFLFKNIFPDLSEALQTLCITGPMRPRQSSVSQQQLEKQSQPVA